jgi:hypothetical protein
LSTTRSLRHVCQFRVAEAIIWTNQFRNYSNFFSLKKQVLLFVCLRISYSNNPYPTTRTTDEQGCTAGEMEPPNFSPFETTCSDSNNFL